MELARTLFYWMSYSYYLYIFGYASLYKIFQKESIMTSMQSLGFNKTWTVLIGIGETIGVLLIIIGLFKAPLRNLGILFLLPFAVGAFATHMAKNEYHHYYNSLMVCILSVILLLLDKKFKILL